MLGNGKNRRQHYLLSAMKSTRRNGDEVTVISMVPIVAKKGGRAPSGACPPFFLLQSRDLRMDRCLLITINAIEARSRDHSGF